MATGLEAAISFSSLQTYLFLGGKNRSPRGSFIPPLTGECSSSGGKTKGSLSAGERGRETNAPSSSLGSCSWHPPDTTLHRADHRGRSPGSQNEGLTSSPETRSPRSGQGRQGTRDKSPRGLGSSCSHLQSEDRVRTVVPSAGHT